MPAGIRISEQKKMNGFQPLLRPPGAGDERTFLRLCVRCGKCLEVCPPGCLRLAAGFGRDRHSPYIDPHESPCELCMKCGPACPTGALDPTCEMTTAGMGRAHILRSFCHNYTNGPMCWTCYDKCPLRGKAMTLVGGITPAVGDACVGCGVCAYVCPKDAIEIVPSSSDYIPPDAAPKA